MARSVALLDVLGAVRSGVALVSIGVNYAAGLVVGSWLLRVVGQDELRSLWILLSPIWLMAAVFLTVALTDRVLGAVAGPDRSQLQAHLGDVRGAMFIAIGGVALCVGAWALSTSPIYPVLGLAVAFVVGTLWEAMPGGEIPS